MALLGIKKVTKNNSEDIPNPCKCCLYWQVTDASGENVPKPEMAQKKREWIANVAKEFGNGAKIAYSDDMPVGFVQFGPARFFPNAREYASGPLSEDAVFIACLYITNKEARGKGVGTAILKDLIDDLKKRGCKAIETFARKSSENNPSGPIEFYLKHGFKVKSEKDDFPLLRLEL
jgi:GNAT superfamily N-acetyltransferase